LDSTPTSLPSWSSDRSNCFSPSASTCAASAGVAGAALGLPISVVAPERQPAELCRALGRLHGGVGRRRLADAVGIGVGDGVHRRHLDRARSLGRVPPAVDMMVPAVQHPAELVDQQRDFGLGLIPAHQGAYEIRRVAVDRGDDLLAGHADILGEARQRDGALGVGAVVVLRPAHELRGKVDDRPHQAAQTAGLVHFGYADRGDDVAPLLDRGIERVGRAVGLLRQRAEQRTHARLTLLRSDLFQRQCRAAALDLGEGDADQVDGADQAIHRLAVQRLDRLAGRLWPGQPLLGDFQRHQAQQIGIGCLAIQDQLVHDAVVDAHRHGQRQVLHRNDVDALGAAQRGHHDLKRAGIARSHARVHQPRRREGHDGAAFGELLNQRFGPGIRRPAPIRKVPFLGDRHCHRCPFWADQHIGSGACL
jgi:hypothetical protein